MSLPPQVGWRSARAVPSPAFGALLAAGALFALLAVRRADPWLGLLAGAIAGPALISLAFRPALTSLAVRCDPPARAVVDEPCEHRFSVRNRGRRSVPATRLQHRLRGFEDVELLVPPLRPGERVERVVRRRPLARGIPVTSVHTLRSGAPFGLLHREVTQHGLSRVVVHPRRSEPADLGALGGDGDLASGVRARSGQEVHGVREWRRGDDVRHVHWRSTARRGELVVVEPERTTGRRVAMLVACRGVSASSQSAEQLLSAAAWSAAATARDGSSLLLWAGSNGPAELHTTDPGQVLDWFASVGVAAPLPLDDARAFLGRCDDADAVVLAAAADVPAEQLDLVRSAGAAVGRAVAVFQPVATAAERQR